MAYKLKMSVYTVNTSAYSIVYTATLGHGHSLQKIFKKRQLLCFVTVSPAASREQFFGVEVAGTENWLSHFSHVADSTTEHILNPELMWNYLHVPSVAHAILLWITAELMWLYPIVLAPSVLQWQAYNVHYHLQRQIYCKLDTIQENDFTNCWRCI